MICRSKSCYVQTTYVLERVLQAQKEIYMAMQSDTVIFLINIKKQKLKANLFNLQFGANGQNGLAFNILISFHRTINNVFCNLNKQ